MGAVFKTEIIYHNFPLNNSDENYFSASFASLGEIIFG
jgi:hypothetical protein